MPSHKAHAMDNKQIAQRFMDECWNQENRNTLSELVEADCRFHDPVFPNLTSGSESLRSHIENCRRGFPDLHFKIDDTIAEGDEVVHHWIVSGTHKGQFLGMAPTHKHATVSGISIFRIKDVKIVEQWTDWNLLSLMEQRGVGAALGAQAHAPQHKAKTHA